MANDLFIIVGAPLLGSSVEQSGNKLIIICNEQKYTINLLVFIRKDSIKLVNLSDVAGVSIKKETVCRIGFVETSTHHIVRNGIGHEVAGVNIRLRFLTELGLFLNVLPENIAGRNRGNLQLLSNLDGLSAFTGAGRAYDQKTVHRSNPS